MKGENQRKWGLPFKFRALSTCNKAATASAERLSCCWAMGAIEANGEIGADR